MNLLQLHNATKQYGAKVLFDRARFSINQGEHVGVIGPNGAGKTTLFKILVGQETLDSGEITKANQLRIGYLEQESEWSLEEQAEDFLTEQCATPIWELKQIGRGLGLTESHFQSPLRLLSGGYRMRMKLLYLIGLQPDLMLLDEPTNFLDLESILSLESFLQDYKSAFLLISHDREFLRRTTEYTLEVEGQEIVKFPGHIDDYFEQKEEVQKIKMQQAANLETKRKHIQEFVDRFRAKATKAKQAQSRMKQLEKMQDVVIKDLPVRSRIFLPTPPVTGKEVVSLIETNLGYSNEKTILHKVNLTIERGGRYGVVGFNGAGKSTLLKSIAGRIALLSGQIKLGYQVELSYFAQHLADELNEDDSVLDALYRKASINTPKQEILGIAGSLLFSGNDLAKKIKVLSGGEKTRVALGQILLQKKPLLLLDEPTNHLDFDTVNALADALAKFEGTLITVSHDRSFIKRVASKMLEIRNGKVEVYPGSYDDYLWSLERGALKERYTSLGSQNLKSTSNDEVRNEHVAKIKNHKAEEKRLAAESKELQRKIKKTEELLVQLQRKLTETTQQLMQARGVHAQQLGQSAASLTKDIEKAENDLLQFMESLENLENLENQ